MTSEIALERRVQAKVCDRKEVAVENAIQAIVVEDSPLVADRIVELITQHRHVRVVACASTEEAALAVCDRQRIDLAIIDLQLHQGTGFGVIHKLREKGRIGATCIVVLTHHAVNALRVAAYEAGADYFLDKAKEFGVLPRIVETVFQTADEREFCGGEWDRTVGTTPR